MLSTRFINAPTAKIIVCDELNINDAVEALQNVSNLENIVVIGTKPRLENCVAIGDLLGCFSC